jgi:3-hydroxy-3-methylglutaryl CoA synthase
MVGITAYGGYIPRQRLDRIAIFQSMGWFAPAIIQFAQGEKSMCNWDEDAFTMAVAASRDCLQGTDRTALDAVYLASTTLPFADRQNAGMISAALNLGSQVVCADHTGSLKAGTSALISALDAVRAGDRKNVLVTASDRRETRSAYLYEMWFGDGAASLLVGSENVIAEFKGSHSVSRDLVDHYRASDHKYDYTWEERWVRDIGYGKIIPEAIEGLLARTGVKLDQVAKVVFPCLFKGEMRSIAKRMGFADRLADNLHEACGETGAAHPFVLLVNALQEAKAGDKIIVASFGQGSDALLFEVTDAIAKLPPRQGIKGALANKKPVNNYLKYLKFRDLMKTEMGIRAEAPTQTAMTVLYRKNAMLMGLVGGKCEKCGTPQFPKSPICVNPACNAFHSQQDYEFAERKGNIKAYTADLLSVSVSPPNCYGMVQFEGGGRMLVDFTDCEVGDLAVGGPVVMTLRKRYEDRERGFHGYFWKAIPCQSEG